MGEIGGELPPTLDPATIDHEADMEAAYGLVPLVETLYARHLEQSKPWYPHLVVPYGLGTTFPDDPKDYLWTPETPPSPWRSEQLLKLVF